MKLLLHPQTNTEVEMLLYNPAHAYVVWGEIGAGKPTLAQNIAHKLLGEASVTTGVHHVKRISATITIEQVREIKSFLKLKTMGSSAIRRVIIIEDADTMTDEAQNALLKTIEEPPADTVILLIASYLENLRDTILSRVQKIHVRPISLPQAEEFFTNATSSELGRAFSVSGGNAGLLVSILDGSLEHPLMQHINEAKKLYGSSTYDRLLLVDKLSQDKAALTEFLYACRRICQGALAAAGAKNQNSSIKAWHKQLSLVHEAEERNRTNASSKLILTNLFMNM